MKRKIGIFFICSFFILTIFSGCTENEITNDKTSGDTINIELVSYKIESQEKVIGGLGIGYNKIADGFVFSEDVFRYFINGTIKNIAEEFIDKVIVHTYFLDGTGSVLGLFNDTVENIAIGETGFFYASFVDQFNLEYVKNVRFEFKLA